MKLIDLDPRWLMQGCKRVGFVFQCPTRRDGKNYQSCFFAQTPSNVQWELFDAMFSEDIIVQGCQPNTAWSCVPSPDVATFENMTISPSIDGSKGGNWHGFIRGGEIVGGL